MRQVIVWILIISFGCMWFYMFWIALDDREYDKEWERMKRLFNKSEEDKI